MKKFISKCFLFVLLWFTPLILFLRFGQLYYHHSEYPMWLHTIKVLQSKFDSKGVIVGDSRAMAGIDPEILGPSFYNLSFGGGTPLEGYFTLRKILAKGNRPELLIFSYAPFHLEIDDVLFERSVKYDFYDWKEIHEIFYVLNKDRNRFWKEKGGTLNKYSYFLSFLDCYWIKLKWPFYYSAELGNMIVQPRISENRKIYETISRQKGWHSFGLSEFSEGLNPEACNDSLDLKKILDEGLRLTCALARKHKIPMVYTIMPFNESSYKRLSKDYLQQYRDFFTAMQKEFPEVKFYYEPFSYDNSFFGDPSHLNVRGKDRFSNELKARLVSDHLYTEIFLIPDEKPAGEQ